MSRGSGIQITGTYSTYQMSVHIVIPVVGTRLSDLKLSRWVGAQPLPTNQPGLDALNMFAQQVKCTRLLKINQKLSV